uniref:Uncharacterized protein n=1 Tax=Arundo donax TaxID=35708 RepID=A0A0A9BSU7_ARUDO
MILHDAELKKKRDFFPWLRLTLRSPSLSADHHKVVIASLIIPSFRNSYMKKTCFGFLGCHH